MARNVRLNRAGVQAMLKSPGMRQAVLTKAGEVARNVTNQGLEASSPGKALGTKIRAAVEEQLTDRQRAVVIVRHPAALAMQAKHGMLTKAAIAAGLEIGGESPDDLIDYVTKAGVTRKATRAQVANWTRGR